MKSRKKMLTIATVVLLAAGLAAGLVLAQEGEEAEIVETTAERTTMMERVAAILGIEESALEDAFGQAKVDGIDEAVANGVLTEEQAEAMKAQIEAHGAMRDVLDEALASGELTEEQLELLRSQGMRGEVSERLQGMRERVQQFRQGLGEDAEALCGQMQGGRGGFFVKTQRGMAGGMWHRGP